MCRSVIGMVRGRPKRGSGGAIPRRPPYRETTLQEVILQLRHLHSAVVVAVAALQRQNCELDADIASLLQRCVCDRLGEQLEKLEAFRLGAVQLTFPSGRPPAGASVRGRSPERGHIKCPR